MSNTLTWHLVRATGLVAFVLLAVSVLWGLALSSPLLGSRRRPARLEPVHRFLSAFTMVMVGLHLLFIWLDAFVRFSLADLFIPFRTTWHPVPVAVGIFAFWMLVIVQVSSLARHRLTPAAWRALHYISFGAFFAAAIHAGAAGTDVATGAFRVGVPAVVIVVAAIIAARVVSGRWRPRRARSSGLSPESPPA